MYGCFRPLDEQRTYWRIAQFLFPFYAMIPTGILGLEVRYRAWVPIDDGHTLAYSVNSVSRYARSVDGRPAPTVDMLPNNRTGTAASAAPTTQGTITTSIAPLRRARRALPVSAQSSSRTRR